MHKEAMHIITHIVHMHKYTQLHTLSFSQKYTFLFLQLGFHVLIFLIKLFTLKK